MTNNIHNLAEAYKEKYKFLLNNYLLEGINDSVDEKIKTINNLNFIKQTELYDYKEESIVLKFDNFKLNVRFYIYELNED